MRITYVTEDTELWGGIAVVFQHLELLASAGHEVFLTTPAPGPDWYHLKVPVHTIKKIEPSLIPAADIIVIASWRIARAIIESKKGIPVYFCQGYEAALPELASFASQINEVYSMGIPTLTVSPHLSAFLKEKFKLESYYVGQMVDRKIFFPTRNPFKIILQHIRTPSRLIVVGPFEGSYKNIATILRGIALASEDLGEPLHLTRVSQFPISRDEVNILRPDEYHCRVSYHHMGRLYRSSDILIALSTEAEGFGLPVLEAMACGVSTILSRIPSYLSFDTTPDYSLFVDSQPEMLSEAIKKIRGDKKLQVLLSKRGLEVAEKFNEKALLTGLVSAFDSIISQK
ncbi:MAG TPA: glycosyltransferase [Thermodesulfovibrionales bacterium]|nr:glycosyltransferase [Thermodesulfovibrionales bacterium]